jgi:hypothetical protein
MTPTALDVSCAALYREFTRSKHSIFTLVKDKTNNNELTNWSCTYIAPNPSYHPISNPNQNTLRTITTTEADASATKIQIIQTVLDRNGPGPIVKYMMHHVTLSNNITVKSNNYTTQTPTCAEYHNNE